MPPKPTHPNRSAAFKAVGDRLMVAVGSKPDSAHLIRLARRQAAPHARWFAVYVDLGRELDPAERRQLAANLDLARKRGASVIVTAGTDLVESLLRIGRQENITRLMVGKPSNAAWWRRQGERYPLEQLVQESGAFELLFVPTDSPPAPRRFVFPLGLGGWREWVIAGGMLTGVTALAALIERTLGYSSVPPVYLLNLIFSSLLLSRWPVMMLAFGSTLAWWFFLLPQQFSLRIHRSEDGLMLALFFVTALVSGHLAARLRSRERGGIEGERTARTLYDLLDALNEHRDSETGGLDSAIAKVENVFEARVALLRPGPGLPELLPHPAGRLVLSEQDQVTAGWAFHHRQWAGRGTDSHPDSASTFVPLLTGEKVRGVLAFQLKDANSWSVLQHELMQSIARLLAQMMEREETARQAREAGIALESQKMQRALVDNFSHEMHTPISVLAGVIQHLRQQDRPAPEQEALREASIAVERLNLVVGEMMDLSQLECGTLRPSLEWCDTADFLQEWLDGKPADTRGRLALSLPPHPVYIRVDTRLLTTALDNILDNALRHAPAGTLVQLDAHEDENQFRIDITDRGSGIAPDQRDKIFDRFFRGSGETPGGLGLGLPIARQFIELMGGTLTVASPPDGGVCFTFSLHYARELKLENEVMP